MPEPETTATQPNLTKEFSIGVGNTTPPHPTGMHMLTNEGKELIDELRIQNGLLEKQTHLWQRIATYTAMVAVIVAIVVPALIAAFVPAKVDLPQPLEVTQSSN